MRFCKFLFLRVSVSGASVYQTTCKQIKQLNSGFTAGGGDNHGAAGNSNARNIFRIKQKPDLRNISMPANNAAMIWCNRTLNSGNTLHTINQSLFF